MTRRPMVLSLEPIDNLNQMLVTEFRTVTRDRFCEALGFSRYALGEAERRMRFALPDDWRSATYTDFSTQGKRPDLSPYQVWVMHVVLTEKKKFKLWDDYARIAAQRKRPDGTHILCFETFLAVHDEWRQRLVDRGAVVLVSTAPKIWEALD